MISDFVNQTSKATILTLMEQSRWKFKVLLALENLHSKNNRRFFWKKRTSQEINKFFIQSFSLKNTSSKLVLLNTRKQLKVICFFKLLGKYTLIMDLIDILIKIIDTETENFYLTDVAI